jgi:hypothetical protein
MRKLYGLDSLFAPIEILSSFHHFENAGVAGVMGSIDARKSARDTYFAVTYADDRVMALSLATHVLASAQEAACIRSARVSAMPQ